MAAGKTVATQIEKFAVTKRAVSMNNYLDKVVEQHPSRHRQYNCEQSVPTFSQYQNQNRDQRDRGDPEGGPSVAQSEHQIDGRSCEMPMKPCSDLMLDARDAIDSKKIETKKQKRKKPTVHRYCTRIFINNFSR